MVPLDLPRRLLVRLGSTVIRWSLKPKNLLAASLLALVVIASVGYSGSEYGKSLLRIIKRHQRRTVAARTNHWPPRRDRQFPAHSFAGVNGQPVQLSAYRGKVILLHIVGMPSRTSVAFAGGEKAGPFQGVVAQAKLPSLRDAAWRYGRVRLEDPRLVVVHLILFNRDMQAPDVSELQQWSRHFEVEGRSNEVVLGGNAELAIPASRKMTPGVMLIDRRLIVQSLSLGSTPLDDLYLELLPQLRQLLDAVAVDAVAVPEK